MSCGHSAPVVLAFAGAGRRFLLFRGIPVPGGAKRAPNGNPPNGNNIPLLVRDI